MNIFGQFTKPLFMSLMQLFFSSCWPTRNGPSHNNIRDRFLQADVVTCIMRIIPSNKLLFNSLT